MEQFTFQSRSMADTQRLGAALARTLPPSAVIALNGPLGSGKTALVQAVAAAAGVARQNVTSPTFILINEYQGRLPIYHFDAYRLADEDEFLQLGPEEYFTGGGWTFIEWAERVASCLPREHLEIRAESAGEQARTYHLRGSGRLARDVLPKIVDALGGG